MNMVINAIYCGLNNFHCQCLSWCGYSDVMSLWSAFIPNGELMIHMGKEKKQLNQFGRFLDFPGAAIYVFENKESWRQEVYWELPGRPYFSQLRSWTKRKWCISQPQLTTRRINTCFWHHFGTILWWEWHAFSWSLFSEVCSHWAFFCPEKPLDLWREGGFFFMLWAH